MISKIPKWILAGGAVLAFTAGMINAIALIGFSHQGVTHVTGNFSRLSIALFRSDQRSAVEIIFILLSFFFGAFLSGVIVRDAHLKLGRRYGWALGLESVLLFLSAYAFSRVSIYGEYFASMAAGLQNALASTFSGAIIRTTHLTGVVTDLGVLAGQSLHGLPVDKRKVKLLITLISGFLLGGVAGAWLQQVWGMASMLVPALIIGVCAVGYSIIRKYSWIG